MKIILIHLFFWLGHFVSKLLRLGAFSFLYPIYNKLMIISSDLDDSGKIWKKP